MTAKRTEETINNFYAQIAEFEGQMAERRQDSEEVKQQLLRMNEEIGNQAEYQSKKQIEVFEKQEILKKQLQIRIRELESSHKKLEHHLHLNKSHIDEQSAVIDNQD